MAVAALMPRLPRSGTLGYVDRMSCFGWAVNVRFWRIAEAAAQVRAGRFAPNRHSRKLDCR
ncbi:hypothetical protein BREVUG8_110912 [Brevundimonas sp. G8]|nr:hypothetical protein BREVUG8_110912 [Brevundimonas sp. G8]